MCFVGTSAHIGIGVYLQWCTAFPLESIRRLHDDAFVLVQFLRFQVLTLAVLCLCYLFIIEMKQYRLTGGTTDDQRACFWAHANALYAKAWIIAVRIVDAHLRETVK